MPAEKRISRLPADPEGMNDERARLAGRALRMFAKASGLNLDSEAELVVRDLLANLGHWCDRHELSFPQELGWARERYQEETAAEGRQL